MNFIMSWAEILTTRLHIDNYKNFCLDFRYSSSFLPLIQKEKRIYQLFEQAYLLLRINCKELLRIKSALILRADIYSLKC